MYRRLAGVLGMLVPLWFVASYVLVAALRSDYRHLNMAISELGSLGAPNALLWNVLGYIVPGAIIAYLGWTSRTVLPGSRRGSLVAVAVALSGGLLLVSGLFPGDFEHRTSATMLVHTLASIVSFVFFLLGGFGLASLAATAAAFRGLHMPMLIVVWLAILSGVVRSGALPGLGQRITFACYFIWIAFYGWGVFRSGENGTNRRAA